MKNNKFAFLSSPRFWQLCIAGIAAGIQTYEKTGNGMMAISAAVGIWLGGSVVVGTVDRNADKKVAAAAETRK
jgi:hypothetical protein